LRSSERHGRRFGELTKSDPRSPRLRSQREGPGRYCRCPSGSKGDFGLEPAGKRFKWHSETGFLQVPMRVARRAIRRRTEDGRLFRETLMPSRGSWHLALQLSTFTAVAASSGCGHNGKRGSALPCAISAFGVSTMARPKRPPKWPSIWLATTGRASMSRPRPHGGRHAAGRLSEASLRGL